MSLTTDLCFTILKLGITDGQTQHRLLTAAVWNRYIKQLMVEAGLKVQIDAIGNTFGLWEGSEPNSGEGAYLCWPSAFCHLRVQESFLNHY